MTYGKRLARRLIDPLFGSGPLQGIATDHAFPKHETVAAAVVPGEFAIAAFAPPLDPAGNSVRGLTAVAAVAKSLGCNLYRSRRS